MNNHSQCKCGHHKGLHMASVVWGGEPCMLCSCNVFNEVESDESRINQPISVTLVIRNVTINGERVSL